MNLFSTSPSCKHGLLAGFLVFQLSIVWAQPAAIQTKPGAIAGTIHSETGEPLTGINVGLEGTPLGAPTNEQGHFMVKNIPAGTYTFVATGIGYSATKQNVVVQAGKTTRLSLQLNASAHQLNEVVVKAQTNPYHVPDVSPSLRLQTPLLELPQNIQIVTSQLLADQQVFDMLEGVSRNVSGVTKQEHWDNYVRLNMRGSRVAPFRNGMNVQSTWGPLAEDMSMVERIEFVKGPAGFMMANGEPSGFYNIVTKKPTGVTKGATTFTLGSFDTYRATADLDGKLSKDGKLLYRINLMGQLKNSFRDFDYNNRYTIAPVIKYQFTPQTSLTLEYTYQYAKTSPIGSAYVFSPNHYAELPRSFSTSEPNLEPSTMKDHSAFLILEHKISDQWKFTGQLAYFNYNQIGSSLWPSAEYDKNGNIKTPAVDAVGNLRRSVGIWDAFNESKFGQFFVNGDVETGPIAHRILAGLDLGTKEYMADWNQSFNLFDSEHTFNVYQPVHGLPTSLIPVFDRSRSLRARAGTNVLSQSFSGLYVQDELRFWQDRIRLTLAGRYTSTKDSQYGAATNISKFTPRVGISGSVIKNTSLYALYDQAFVPQAGADFLGNAFKPITGNNLEAGLKKDWMNGRWNSTLSIYQITKNNVLVNDPEHLNMSLQLGQTVTKGVEIDVKGEILPHLSLTMNYAYTDSKITQDTKSENVGQMVPGFAKHLTNGWLSYRLSRGLFQGLGFSGGYQWQLDRSSWGWNASVPNQALPTYFRLDGAISWQRNSFNVAFNVNNLLDKYLFSGAAYESYYYSQVEAPRNFRLSVGYKF